MKVELLRQTFDDAFRSVSSADRASVEPHRSNQQPSTVTMPVVLPHSPPSAFPVARSESAIVVLDDLHRLVEMVQVGTQITVSHSLLHAVNTLLTTTPPAGGQTSHAVETSEYHCDVIQR